MGFDIDDEDITYARDHPGVVGPDRVMLDGDDNLIAGNPWEPQGWTIEPFLEQTEWTVLREGLTVLLRDNLRTAGAEVPDGFVAERYHEYATDDAVHREVATRCGRGFPADGFPLDAERVRVRLEEICGVPLGIHEGLFNLRVVRPRSTDNNPLHRDVWLDHLRNAVNIYVPIAGSDERSSLALVPGSHHWSEAEIVRTEHGAVINNVRFTVPSVVGSRRSMRVIRPNPSANEVLVFSPYLIHGGASNLNRDRTRLSLEMRFWRRRP